MGEFEHELIAIDWINLFNSAIDGNPAYGLDVPCFRKFGYFPIYFPKFSIEIEENGSSVKKEVPPDFLLINLQLHTALLFEVKGIGSMDEDNETQLTNFDNISLEDIERIVENDKDLRNVRINTVIVGIVYRREIIENSRSHSESNSTQILNRLKENHLILYQQQGDKLIALNPEQILNDPDLAESLREGIPLPLNPKKQFYVTEKPCTKGIIAGIIEYLIDRFYSGEDLKSITLTSTQLKNDVFRFSRVETSKCREALQYLNEKHLCSYNADTEQFGFTGADVDELLRNHDIIFKELHDFPCPKPPTRPRQEGLGQFIRSPNQNDI